MRPRVESHAPEEPQEPDPASAVYPFHRVPRANPARSDADKPDALRGHSQVSGVVVSRISYGVRPDLCDWALCYGLFTVAHLLFHGFFGRDERAGFGGPIRLLSILHGV